jgi:hypothetical protein
MFQVSLPMAFVGLVTNISFLMPSRISSFQGNKLSLKATVSNSAHCHLHGRKLQNLSNTTLPMKADTRQSTSMILSCCLIYRHARLVNIPYYMLRCLKNMLHYSKKAKNPALSLTHHRLTQLLIQKGFAPQNPPLKNPPIDPQEPVEIPENLQEQQPQNPSDPPEVPNSMPIDPINPIHPPNIPSPPHILPESSTPVVHILSDDSETDNSPCPIIEEKPPRKRKQIPFFPPFLQRKRTRASTRAATTATALNPQPIQLKPHASPTSPIQESLPIPPTSTGTQEPEAQYVPTSSFSNQVAETQEPTTHLVAETQEPTTHSVAETQEPDTHQVAETQEPTTHQVAETHEPATHSVAETQEPVITVTQEPATTQTQEPVIDFVTKTHESDA